MKILDNIYLVYITDYLKLSLLMSLVPLSLWSLHNNMNVCSNQVTSLETISYSHQPEQNGNGWKFDLRQGDKNFLLKKRNIFFYHCMMQKWIGYSTLLIITILFTSNRQRMCRFEFVLVFVTVITFLDKFSTLWQ